jgi:hypothetical protein
VSSKEQMVTALAMAKNQPQVNRVINNLEVQSTRPVQNGENSGVQQTSLPEGGADFEPQSVANRQTPARPASTTSSKMARKPVPVGTPINNAGAPTDGRSKPGSFVPQQARKMGPNPRMASNMKSQGPAMPVTDDAAGGPLPSYVAGGPQGGIGPARYDQPHMPNHAWPGYAAYPNYAGVTYPRQYSPSAWPYIGPFYPYPQVPLGWRKVTLEWDDGWWYLDFFDRSHH